MIIGSRSSVLIRSRGVHSDHRYCWDRKSIMSLVCTNSRKEKENAESSSPSCYAVEVISNPLPANCQPRHVATSHNLLRVLKEASRAGSNVWMSICTTNKQTMHQDQKIIQARELRKTPAIYRVLGTTHKLPFKLYNSFLNK